MKTNLAYIREPGKVLTFPGVTLQVEEATHTPTQDKPVNTDPMLKSNGQPKATPAEPIRDIEDVKKLLAYFKEQGGPTKTGKPRCVANRRKYMLFLFGFTCGMRAGDLLELKVGDVRDARGNIRTEIRVQEEKTKKFNSFPITSVMKAELERQLTRRDMQGDLLFPSVMLSKDGSTKSYSIAQVNNMLKKAADKIGIPGHISSHSMRKTCVYHMLKNNEHGREGEMAIQYMLNHSDFSTTLRYCGLSRDMLGEFKNMLSEQFAVD